MSFLFCNAEFWSGGNRKSLVFAKTGSLDDTHHVFAEMFLRNVVSQNKQTRQIQDWITKGCPLGGIAYLNELVTSPESTKISKSGAYFVRCKWMQNSHVKSFFPPQSTNDSNPMRAEQFLLEGKLSNDLHHQNLIITTHSSVLRVTDYGVQGFDTKNIFFWKEVVVAITYGSR